MSSERRIGERRRHGAGAAVITLVIAAGGALAGGCGAEPPASSALLITLDGIRQDALGAQGAAGSSTPNLDLLADHAVRYRWARTVAPASRPAHASMLTGLYPPRHGLRGEREEALLDRAPTVAELARAAGFQTAAFLSSPLLDRGSGLNQGFERFELPRGGASEGPGRTAAEVVRAASSWLRGRDRARPFFLWVNLGAPYPSRRGAGPGGTAAPAQRYRNGVQAADRAIGELIGTLRSLRLFRSTFVAVVGSHGEGLGDHGEASHGLGLWDTTLLVPLLCCYRDGFGSGEESVETVSVVDLAPTLLAAMELAGPPAVPGGLDGMSLYYESVVSDRAVYFESYEGWTRFGWSPLVGCADSRVKLVRGARDEWFDPRRDPAESAPLSGPEPAERERLSEWIRAVQSAPRLGDAERGPLGPADGGPGEAGVDPRVLAALAELGYASPLPVPRARPLPEELEGRVDPRDALDEVEALERARRALQAGDHRGALPQLEGLRARHPAAADVLDALAEALAAAGRHAQAVEALRTRLTLPPELVETHAALRVSLTELGEDELALQHSVRSLELLLERQRRRGDAEALRRTRALLDRARRQAAETLETAAGSAQERREP